MDVLLFLIPLAVFIALLRVRGTQNREFNLCVQKQKKSSQPSTGTPKVPAEVAFLYILSILVLPYLDQLND